jgi:hypothetical protein
MSVKLSCPACNAAFVLPAVPASGRAECPRCGDPFPVRAFEEVPDERGPGTGNGGQKAEERKKRGAKWLLIGLGLLVAIGIGTFFGLREKGPEPLPEPPATARLAGIGYLPPRCNVAFGLEVAPVLAAAEKANQPPREFLQASGFPPAALTALDSAGVPVERVDHIVGAARIGAADADQLVFALCVVTNGPVEADEVRKKLKATPAKKPDRWGVLLGGVPLVLAVPRPNVLLFGFDELGHSALTLGAEGFGPGGAQFAGTDADGMRGLLHAVPDRAAVWVAADDDADWTAKPLIGVLARFPLFARAKPALANAAPFRGGLFALGADGTVRVRVRTADAQNAARVRAYFARNLDALPEARVGGTGTTATYDATHPPAEARELLTKFLTDLGK